MNLRFLIPALLLACFSVAAVRGIAQETADAEERREELERIKQKLTSQSYVLRYKFVADETIRYRVEHLATVDTKIRGNTQTTKSRSVSTKSWQVSDASADGVVTFVHSIDDVDMWSQVSGRQEVRYNSRQDSEPPPEYEAVGRSIGVPLSVVTMDARGKIIRRDDKIQRFDLGMGGLAMPLPLGEIDLGYTWATPYELKVKLQDGRVKPIKIRQLYRLEKVEAGVATISLTAQVLTPVDDPQVRSQLVQRLSHGEVKFDIDAGRILSKQLDWDETVIGFNGADSNMKYLARFTEQLIVSADDSVQPDDSADAVTQTSPEIEQTRDPVEPASPPRTAKPREQPSALRR